ncbi:glycosyltransferase [Glycomyces sp. NPDC047369]
MPAERPRLLYLAYYFPPSRASGVFRARATANHFAEQGWDVTVLRAPDRFFYDIVKSVDEALVETIDPRVKVLQPEMDFFAWENDLRDYSFWRGNFPVLAQKRYQKRLDRTFPEHYITWAESAVKTGRRLHREQPFDLVIATGNPFASFWAAWELERRTKVPFVIDYRDSWTLNQFDNTDKFPPGHAAWRWEAEIHRTAAAAVHVNDAMRAWHAAKYPDAADRMQVVLNGWDPDIMDAEAIATAPDEARPLSFAFIGTLTHVQPIESLLEGHRLMAESGAHPGAALDLYGHIGFFSSQEMKLRAELGLDRERPGVAYRGPVPKSEIGTAYAASDVLVFLNGGSKYVTTGKVFEYMATGKPIVSVHEKGCAAEELLRDYPLWFEPASLDPADVAAAMAEAGDAARKADADAAARARAYARSFTREAALAPFEQWARELVARKAA